MLRIFLSAVACVVPAVASLMAAQVPRPSPEFAISTNGGGQVLLSQYRGKVVALVFIFTTCPHCQQTTQILNKLQNEIGPRGFQVLEAAFNENAILLVPDFIRRFQPAFPVGYCTRDSALEYLQHNMSQPFYVPQIAFIDRKGVIRAQHSGDEAFFQNQEANIRAEAEALLKEPPSAKRNGTRAARKKTS